MFFSEDFKIILSLFSLCHQRCGRTGRVQKIQNFLRKNTIFNEHPVHISQFYCKCMSSPVCQICDILLGNISIADCLPYWIWNSISNSRFLKHLYCQPLPATSSSLQLTSYHTPQYPITKFYVWLYHNFPSNIFSSNKCIVLLVH